MEKDCIVQTCPAFMDNEISMQLIHKHIVKKHHNNDELLGFKIGQRINNNIADILTTINNVDRMDV